MVILTNWNSSKGVGGNYSICAEKNDWNQKVLSVTYGVSNIVPQLEMPSHLKSTHIDNLETRTKNLFETLNFVSNNLGSQLTRSTVHHECKISILKWVSVKSDNYLNVSILVKVLVILLIALFHVYMITRYFSTSHNNNTEFQMVSMSKHWKNNN